MTFQDATVRSSLRRLAQATDDLEPFLRDVGEYLLLSIEKRFEDEVDPEGTPWKPLSPEYAARKKGPSILNLNLNRFLFFWLVLLAGIIF